MRKNVALVLCAVSAAMLLSGCLNLQLGGGTKTESRCPRPTVGQQLVDLQKAKDSGAINDAEYQAQKARILNEK